MTPHDKTAKELDSPSFTVPDGIILERRTGPVSGQPLYRVEGFEMPYQSSEEAAVQVYLRLKAAYANGYFTGNGHRK